MAHQRYQSTSSSFLRGQPGETESTPLFLQSYQPRTKPSQLLFGIFTMRHIVLGFGAVFVASVVYLASLGNRILQELETNRSPVSTSYFDETVRLTPLMGAAAPSNKYQDTATTDKRRTAVGTSSSASVSKVSRFINKPKNLAAANVTILVVYGPEYHQYISNFAWEVAQGVNSSFYLHRRQVTGRVVFGTTSNLTFTDVLAADAVILGSPVYNGNTHPVVQQWINYWHIEADLSRKVGAAFVTAGGMHAGAEGTIMSILRSMMVFQMVAIGGDSWDSPFGAAATMHEDPFGDSVRSGYFDTTCYQADYMIHPHFLQKAFGLGQRVANVTFALKNSTLW